MILLKNVSVGNIKPFVDKYNLTESLFKVGFFKKDGDRNEFLHQIGQSSILNLKVTYGEGGQQVFFKETGAPQHIKLDITFKENFALSRNFVKTLEGNNV